MEGKMDRSQGPSLSINQRSVASAFFLSFFMHPLVGPPQLIIYLRDILNIKHINLKPSCLLLEAKEKRFYLKGDEELYGWQDVYARTPMGASGPTNF